jgi:ABC-type cobalamin/Fe3+-siderophores transport system ATPase subunit
MATSNYRYESTSKTSRLQVQLLKESIDLSEEYQLPRDDGLIMDGLTSIVVKEGDDEKNQDMKNNFDRILFKDLSFKVGSREIFIVGGPSGSGKSQLLRSIAGLSPLNSGTIRLDGEFMHTFDCSSEWRKRVRYVTQYKVDVPGSPRDFVHRIVSFKSWKKDNWPSAETVIESTTGFLEQWGLKGSFLDKEWSSLSGGEAQRIIVAISLASKPNVLLLDESTSSLDMKSKISVESSVDAMTRENGLKILWVSHDPDIFRRYE